jgi:class 3 adenylate cyclase
MNTTANQRMPTSSSFSFPLPLTQSPTKVSKFLAANVEGKNVTKEEKSGQPIADLYPSATVFFADIAGFTGWSATREPTQVFTLLETVYNEFDQIADQLNVFKVSGRCVIIGLAYCLLR